MDQPQATSQKTLDKLSLALESGTFVDVRRMLNGLAAADVAHLLESSPPKFRHILWQMVEVDQEVEPKTLERRIAVEKGIVGMRS